MKRIREKGLWLGGEKRRGVSIVVKEPPQQHIRTTEAEAELIDGEGKKMEEEKTVTTCRLLRHFPSRSERVR